MTILGGLVVGGGVLVFLFAGCMSMLDSKSPPELGQSIFAIILGGVVMGAGAVLLWRR